MRPFRNFMILLACAALGTVSAFASDAEPQFSDVYRAGADGFAAYRIPSLVVAADKTLLAFAEARATLNDQSQNKIVLKRSTDGGRSWAGIQVVADDARNSLNNPCAVVLRESGRILLMYQRYPQKAHEHNVKPGYDPEDACLCFLTYSDDHGKTWAPPQDVTRSVKRPAPVTSIASGPGIGIQLSHGPHAGRIIMPFNEGPAPHWKLYAALSDDSGLTWTRGNTASEASKGTGNEVQMVELSDGSVRLNSRSEGGSHVRKTAVSKDGGMTWSDLIDVEALADPSCCGSILRFSDAAGGKSRILFSGPGSKQKRTNGTVWLSYDEAETWPVTRQLVGGPFAYSVLSVLPDGTVGCLFETGAKSPYERITFAQFSLRWLTDGKEAP